MGNQLKSRIIEQITVPSERTKQTRLGPSGVGNPCPHCVAEGLLGRDGEREFSLYPWIGTAVHFFLESHAFQTDGMLHEKKLYVGEVEGYGPIKGTSDLVMVDDNIVLDWKIVGLKKIKEYRVKGIPEQYRYQAQLYAQGCANEGIVVESVAIVFIPRDSGNVNDIWVYEEAVQPEMAETALQRAALIFKRVNEVGLDNIPSSDECYQCNMKW